MRVPPYIRKVVTSAFVASITLSLTPVTANASPLLVNDKPSVSSNTSGEGEQRYIVQYDDNVNPHAKSQALEDEGIEVKNTFSHSIKAAVVVASPNDIEVIKNSEGVSNVELDQPVSIAGATSIWGLDRIDQRTGRDGQYNTGNEGSGVNIYIVDSGLYPGHSQFEGRVPAAWSGINDGRGWSDCNGHGTHVAGTAAGTTYGVAKTASIIPIRVLDCNGSGWSSTVIAGLDWAIAHHQPSQPAVLNMSIGGFTTASLDSSVRKTINDGITVVAAAGNSNQDACYSAPASVVPAITVAATDINDFQASFSNWGSCVDIQAPGVSIRSAYNNAPTGYNTLSGTSMAAPHVAGAAAIMLSRNRSLSPAQVADVLINNSTIGVINGNKGASPNRLLFIPALTGPSCANLKLGDAWAGVGTTCRSSGALASPSDTSTDPATEMELEASAPVDATPNLVPIEGEEPAAPAPPAPATPAAPAPAELVTPVASGPAEPVSSPAAPVNAQVLIEAPQAIASLSNTPEEADSIQDSPLTAVTSPDVAASGVETADATEIVESASVTIDEPSHLHYLQSGTIGLAWMIVLASLVVLGRKCLHYFS